MNVGVFRNCLQSSYVLNLIFYSRSVHNHMHHR